MKLNHRHKVDEGPMTCCVCSCDLADKQGIMLIIYPGCIKVTSDVAKVIHFHSMLQLFNAAFLLNHQKLV